MRTMRKNPCQQRGGVLIMSMLFLAVFSALAVALATTSGASVQLASNQHNANGALHAAQSGLECAKYIMKTVALPETNSNSITIEQADQTWTNLCAHLQYQALDGKTVASAGRFCDAFGAGDEIETPSLGFSNPPVQFAVRFYRYDADPHTIKMEATGADGLMARKIAMDAVVTKDRDVLSYAVATRGRMWLAGNTTVHGDLFSTWDVPGISPFNTTSDSAVLGTIGTVRTLEEIDNDVYHLETLDVNDCPVDIDGNPLGENYGDRYYGANDEIQGYHEGIYYGQPYSDMPGMDISHYNTDEYTAGLSTIPSCPSGSRVTEYFPHAAGNYSQPRDGGSTSFTRHVYEDQTFSDTLLPINRHALFRNCTFEGILYVDCYKSSTSKSYTNNVRFEDCTFNGVIVTDVPQPFNWKNNCLYFTGEAAFDNQSDIQEATILAPHFNVNLGNTNPQQSDNNVLTGAIVGGIVDVRGNAQIYGTIISMADTSMYSSGYVTNIGATLDDGGSETTELGDIGVISITPEEDMMLPSGITAPIVIKPDPQTYSECI